MARRSRRSSETPGTPPEPGGLFSSGPAPASAPAAPSDEHQGTSANTPDDLDDVGKQQRTTRIPEVASESRVDQGAEAPTHQEFDRPSSSDLGTDTASENNSSRDYSGAPADTRHSETATSDGHASYHSPPNSDTILGSTSAKRRRAPSGSLEDTAPSARGAIVFFAVAAVGISFIVGSKLYGLPAAIVVIVPVVIMVIYTVIMLAFSFLRLRDDQAGDNLYYLGFLFTLTSIGTSLYQFSGASSADDIVRNFGIAITSTIAGLLLRIALNQMQTDPAQVERVVRYELSESARRLRTEIDLISKEFGFLSRSSQQQVKDILEVQKELVSEIRAFIDVESRRSDEFWNAQSDGGVLATLRVVEARLEAMHAAAANGLDQIHNSLIGIQSAVSDQDRARELLDPLMQVNGTLGSLHEQVAETLPVFTRNLSDITNQTKWMADALADLPRQIQRTLDEDRIASGADFRPADFGRDTRGGEPKSDGRDHPTTPVRRPPRRRKWSWWR